MRGACSERKGVVGAAPAGEQQRRIPTNRFALGHRSSSIEMPGCPARRMVALIGNLAECLGSGRVGRASSRPVGLESRALARMAGTLSQFADPQQ